MNRVTEILRKPVITEKTTVLKEKGVLAFEVDARANKVDIRRAVESIFKVKVASVNIQNKKGTLKRLGRNIGRTASVKKAYVKLREGEKPVEYFEELKQG